MFMFGKAVLYSAFFVVFLELAYFMQVKINCSFDSFRKSR